MGDGGQCENLARRFRNFQQSERGACARVPPIRHHYTQSGRMGRLDKQ